MAFKMIGMEFGEGTGSAYKKPYGTSIKDLTGLSLEEKRDYKKWKKSERGAGRKGAHHDNTYEAYLASLNKPEKSKRRRTGEGWQKIKDWFSNLKLPYSDPSFSGKNSPEIDFRKRRQRHSGDIDPQSTLT